MRRLRSSTRKTPAKPSPYGTTAELKMLFDRGSRSRGMIGLRVDRQTSSCAPAGRSSHGIGVDDHGETGRSDGAGVAARPGGLARRSFA
jgi:hypothetical protein